LLLLAGVPSAITGAALLGLTPTITSPFMFGTRTVTTGVRLLAERNDRNP
jgi:hypothetical protein